MANRYWVGGSGTWNIASTTNWSATSGGASGASVPTSSDNVIVDTNSGSPTITLGAGISCLSLTTTGATCIFSGTGTLRIYGNITLSSTTTWSATGLVTIVSSSTITTNGVTIGSGITFNAVGGTLILGSALSLGATKTFSFNNGTLNLNNFTLSTGVFASSVVTTRQIQFGTGNITTTGSANAFTLNGLNFSYTGTPTVNVSNNSSTATTVSISNITEPNALNFNYTIGTYVLTDAYASYKNLNFTGFTGTATNQQRYIYGNLTIPATGGTYSTGTYFFLATSGTQTITTGNRASLTSAFTFGNYLSAATTFAINGAFQTAGVVTHKAGTLQFTSGVNTSFGTFTSAGPVARAIKASTPGTRATLAANPGIVVFTGTITDIVSFSSFTSYGTNGGNNVGITFTSGYTGALYWVGGSGSWGTTNTKFALTSGGTATSLTPDASTPVIVDANSGSPTITVGSAVCAGLTTTGATCTFTGSGFVVTIAGGLVLSATTTWSPTTASSISATYSGTITTNGVTLSITDINFGELQTGSTALTYTLGNALTIGGANIIITGSVNLNNFSFTSATFVSNQAVPRQIQFGTTGNITVTGSGSVFTLNAGTFSYTGTPTVNISNNSATASSVSILSLVESNALNVNYTTGTYVLTESAGVVYKNLNFTGFNGTVGNVSRTIYGSLTIPASGGTYTAGAVNQGFYASSGTQTITTNGRTVDFPFDLGSGNSTDTPTFAINGAFTQGSTRAFNLNNGTLQLTAGTTAAVGIFQTSINNASLISSTPGTQATISSATNATVLNLTIKDNNATGGAVWDATSVTNTNAGNVTGWLIAPYVAPSSGNFFLLF